MGQVLTTPAGARPVQKLLSIDFYNSTHPEVDKMEQIVRMAEALARIHENRTPHGNFWPANVQVDQDGRLHFTNTGNYQTLLHATYIPIPASYAYQSPQVLEEPSCVSLASDVYSFACMMYKIFTGKSPYNTLSPVQGVVRIIRGGGHRALARPTQIPASLWTLMVECWSLSPAHRPSMAQVLRRLRGLR
ncbi:kinase-like protein [Athelia psychrophila]|uniref:Kinase-like protein n=1 Tax=Athelia psychrophila TaxID=1759441 RepID=A0A166B0S6_9AGAM|nr:kinase-like protein [Fibularhizoctonia sp. CBS 109695]